MLTKKISVRLLLILGVLSMILGASIVVAQDEVSLTVSFPGDTRSEVVNQLIGEFVDMKAGEGVTVDVQVNEPTDAYFDQLLLDFSAGVGPDVFSISAESIPEFVGAELIMPLDDLVDMWDGWDAFPEGMREMPSLNDSTYAVMYDTDTRVLFYRLDVFEAAGIETPWEPTSWEDIFTAAQQIQDNVEDVVPMMVESGTIWGEGTTIDGFFMLFNGAGGTLLDTETGQWVVESPALLEAFQFYERMFSNEYALAEPFMEPEPWVFYLQEGLSNGDVAMAVAVSAVWGLLAPDSEWGPIENRDEVLAWTPMPAREAGAGVNDWDFVGMGGGWGWSISQETDNADLAWEFVQFMTSATSISAYTDVIGSIPARTDAETNEFNAALAELVLPYQAARPGHSDYNRVSEQIQIATERILLGEATAEEAMALFAEAVEDIVGSDNVTRMSAE